eukprot:Lankesteria_metandrocarpae@DN4315_c0_g1_i1.p1
MELVVDAVRAITEHLIWGDQNDVDEIFMYFCEANMMALFTSIISQYGLPAHVKVQTLKTIHILLQNLSNEKSLLYLCSRNHINELIATVSLDTSDEDVTSWFTTLLKSLALRVKPDTITLFFNPATTTPFPLFGAAVKLLSHDDSMVRTHCQAVTLQIFELVKDNAQLAEYLGQQSSFFNLVVEALRKCYRGVMSTANEFNPKKTECLLAELEDCLLYIHDILSCGVSDVADTLEDCILLRAVIPELIRPASGSTTARVHLDLREFASGIMCILMTMKVANSESLLLILSFILFSDMWPSSEAFGAALRDEWTPPEAEGEYPHTVPANDNGDLVCGADHHSSGCGCVVGTDWPGVAATPLVVRKFLHRLNINRTPSSADADRLSSKDNLFRKQLIGILSPRGVETSQWASSYVAVLGITGYLFKLKPRSCLSEDILKHLRVLPSTDEQGTSLHEAVLSFLLNNIESLNSRLVSATCRWIFAIADATSEPSSAHLRTFEIKALTEARKLTFSKFLKVSANVMPVVTVRAFEEEWMLLLNDSLVDPLSVSLSSSLFNVGSIDSAQYLRNENRYALRNTIRSGLILVKVLGALAMTTMEQQLTGAPSNGSPPTGATDAMRLEHKSRIFDSGDTRGVEPSSSRSSSLSSLPDESSPQSKRLFEVGSRVSLGLKSHKTVIDTGVMCNLANLELIRCSVKRKMDTATPDDNFFTGVRYFLAQEGYLMLVQPDYRKAGCGIIRFLELLHRINFAVDATQPLVLILQANPTNSHSTTKNGVAAARKDFGAALFGVNTTGSFGGHSTVVLQFEDHARRTIAEVPFRRSILLFGLSRGDIVVCRQFF